MRIKRLKLTGFKSFVEPAELRIEPGLTGVVGPNGCGKSNLLEAIRWVMGESSPKSMRGGGMDDVIFAGTETRPPRGFAEVTILAERDGGETPGPIAAANDGDLEVVRRIERGSGSAYRVNGRDVRARDVALIFADAATGAHSPALVSQGRIGAVIAAKPQERRQMLEEAAGIAGLHVRRKDAEQRLRATEGNLERLDQLLGDMDGRAAALRRQAKQAERYRKLTTDIRQAEARLIYARWRDADAAAASAGAEAERAESAVRDASEAQRAAAAHQQAASEAVARAREAAQAARDASAEAGRVLTALESERAQLDRRLADLSAQTARLGEDRAREGSLAHDAAEALSRLGDEGKMLEARLAAGARDKPVLAARLAEAESVARDAEVALAQALAAQASEHAETRVAQAALAAARTRLARAVADCERIARDETALVAADPLVQRRETASREREHAEREAQVATQAIEAKERDRAAASAARERAESDAAAARSALAALESEAKALARALAPSDAVERLLDRLSAAPGFERALAAALADDMAQPLESWRGAEGADDPPLPNEVTPLAARVEAPAALARRLAQIGVVDQDRGQALAAGQVLVTRDGALRRWDGFATVDAGGAAADRLLRANRLAAIEAELPAARREVEATADVAADAAATLDAVRREIEAARARRATAEPAARAAAREVDQLNNRIERLTAQHAEIAERTARAESERALAESEQSAAEAAAAALPDRARGDARVAALHQAAGSARTQVATARAEGAALDRSLTADRERQSAVRGESSGWRARAGEAAKRIEQMARREVEAEAERAMLVDAPARLGAQIVTQKGEANARAAAADAARAAEREAEAALREVDGIIADAREALALARETRAGAAARAEAQVQRRVEMARIAGERFECPPPLLPERVDFASTEVGAADTESGRHDRLVADRERIGPVNLVAESELAELEETRRTSAAERDELGQAIARLRGSIGSLNREGRQRLLAAFEAVDGHFRRLFTTLFNGGKAHLALIESDDPLEAGLEIYAQPPGKKLAALTLLSGGEQALTAVALIFALFLTNPAPICVLDEVDAPLDDANIERFCDLLDAMTRETDTRYLIVTHNAVTMSRMHRLFGVTMIERGVSRLVSVDLGGAEQLLAAE